jgi:capsular polysaccharide biosynthesis protein
MKHADRQFPGETIARIVADLGGKVVVTEGMRREDFAALAEDADCVIADHGAALFNILQWNTRGIIELVTDNWWSKCFVFLATSCGVENHALVRSDGRGEAELRAVLTRYLTAFRA